MLRLQDSSNTGEKAVLLWLFNFRDCSASNKFVTTDDFKP